MTHPSSIQSIGNNRIPVEEFSSGFFAGTQFRTFKEITLAAGASIVVRMTRTVNMRIDEFSLSVNDGIIRCEVYRGATPSGSWSTALPVIPKNEMSLRPLPLYTSGVTIDSGGSITGGTLYDLIIAKTSGAVAQASTVGSTGMDHLGVPIGSAYYKFSNPGSSSASGIFVAQWEEFPT